MAVDGNINIPGDDANKKHDDIDSSFGLNLTFGDTLYLHPNDTNGSPILGFSDGSCKRDNNNPSLANQWDMRNYVVSDLKETYDKVDGSAVFNLHKSINSLNQNGAPLAEYYNNLNSLWKQFDAIISLPPCTCEAAKHFEKHNQLIKLMQFLMGLDESYLAIRNNILTRETTSKGNFCNY
ncbi:hypothetical protein Tco_0850162 [Tanacetum coccineum]